MSDRRKVWIARAGLFFLVLIVVSPLIATFLPLLPWLFIGLSFEAFESRSAAPNVIGVDRGAYYRVTARYLVDYVEPLDFDLVVACAENRPETAGSKWGLLPAVYAKPTQQNHVVLLAVPDFCGRVKGMDLGKRHGYFDGSFLPFTIWFEEAKNLEFGLGYASIQAYDSPSARLSFLEATVRYASREEFEEWYAYDNHNLIQPNQILRGPVGTDVMGKDMLARACHGIGFAQVSTKAQSVLSEVWSDSRPRYWSFARDSEKSWHDIRRKLIESDDQPFVALDRIAAKVEDLDWYSSGSVRSFSSLNRSKLSNYVKFRSIPTEYYPVYFNDGIPFLREDQSISNLSANIDMRPETRGFVACYTRVPEEPAVEPTESSTERDQAYAAQTANNGFELKLNGEPQIKIDAFSDLGGYLIEATDRMGKFSSFSYWKSTGKVN